MDNGIVLCADRIINICEELKVLLSVNGAFDSYRSKLLGMLQQLSLEIGSGDFNEDAKLADVSFITVKNGEHVPIKDGKAVGGPMKGLDFSKAKPELGEKAKVSRGYGSPYPIEEISAQGINKPSLGFSEKKLEEHYEGHKHQYPGMTKEQYNEHAKKFLQKKCGDTVLGFRCKDGSVVRFNKQTGEFVKGYPGGYIKTCFFPTDIRKGEDAPVDIEYAMVYFSREKRDSYD